MTPMQILIADRNEWKRRAVKAESDFESARADVARLERELGEAKARFTDLQTLMVQTDQATWGGLRQLAKDTQAALESALAREREALAALRGMLEPFEGDECRIDHHGACQEHFLSEPCIVARARAILSRTPADAGATASHKEGE